MTTKSFADVVVQVGTNDISTKFPMDKIIENMSQIMDTAKHISVTGNVTISGVCPRTDNSDAALKGNDVCDRVQQICADKGCIFVDHRDTFLTRSGDTIDELLLIDGLHLSSAGTKKLLQNLKLSSMTSCKIDVKRNRWHDGQSNQQAKSAIRNPEMTQQPRIQPMYGAQHARDLRRTHPGQRREFSSSIQNKNNSYPTTLKRVFGSTTRVTRVIPTTRTSLPNTKNQRKCCPS